MSPRPRTNLAAIVADDVVPAVKLEELSAPSPAPASVPIPVPAGPRSGTLKARTHQFSLYLEPAVHDKLREIAYVERVKIHQLVMEGVDRMLKARGQPSVKKLVTG
jgi:hypothetical protein